MTPASRPFHLLRRMAGPALGILVIGYFLAAAVIGENGVLSWGEYRRATAERQEKLATLKAEEQRLTHRSGMLDPAHTDPDLADEMTRRTLHVVRPDEVVVPLR
jgi:cell division protein FtsB